MKKLKLALPVVLIASAVITLACASPSAGSSPQPTTPAPTATAVPLPTATPVPPTEVPAPVGLSQEELEALQAELNANIEKWQQAGVSSYEYQFRVNCFCPTDITSPVSITVRDSNTIDSILYVESGEPVTQNLDLYLTVGGMFDMIQEAIDMKVANLTVSYDSELGYPTSVFIDRDFMMADEERGFEVTNLEPIETPTLDELQSQLDANRQLWESSGPSDYHLQYRRVCFCPTDVTAPVTVSVSDGAIESLTYVETGEPVGEAFSDLFPSVPGMFDIIQDAIDQDAERIQVSYDPGLGYPVSISIDYSYMIADEELGFSEISLNQPKVKRTE